MKNLKWAISGFALGLVIALAPSCGPARANCTAANCPGCCDADGKCELGTSTNACGLNAIACTVCGPADQCQGGFCRPITGSQKDAGTGNDGGNGDGGSNTDGGTDGGSGCNASNCLGCCAANGTCIQPSQQNNLTCGTNGVACQQCTGSFVCNQTQGICQDTSCLAGCVQGGQCLTGTSNASCGTNGVACVACGANQTCTNGVCTGGSTTCNASTCPNGCCNGAGQCVPGTTTSSCGAGGQACGVCGSGQTCSPTSGGGFCQGGSGGTFGAACSASAPCQSGLTCKQTTSTGNATYSGGYCTKTCTAAADCPTGTASCVNFGVYGEDQICVDECSSTDPCRTGYQCYPLSGGTTSVCWISPLPTVDAGMPPPANLIGSACANDTNCQNNGNYGPGFCIQATDSTGASTGFTSGYCSGDCSLTSCGTTAECFGFDNGMGGTADYCLDLCTTGGAGQSNCRSGYVCYNFGLADGGTSTNGYCWPNCNNVSGFCGSTATCQTNGYCQ